MVVLSEGDQEVYATSPMETKDVLVDNKEIDHTTVGDHALLEVSGIEDSDQIIIPIELHFLGRTHHNTEEIIILIIYQIILILQINVPLLH